MAQLKIRVRANEKKTHQGKTFMVYKCREKDGTYTQLKFTKDVKNAPTNSGSYDMIVESTDMNPSMNDFGKVWWCRNAIAFEEPEYTDEAVNAF